MTYRMMTAVGALALSLGLATAASAQQGMQPGMGGNQMQQGGMEQGGMQRGGMRGGMKSKKMMKRKKMMRRNRM